MSEVVIGKVKDKHGQWGNMAPFPVIHEGNEFRTTEALFQALRFDDKIVVEEIRSEKSPMAAKFVAKRNKHKMFVVPLSDKDLDNMRLCLRLKIEQHSQLRDQLLDTGNSLIVEDCTKRQRGSGLFWGAFFDNGEWKGQNWLGVLWMELRDQLRNESLPQ
jgi:ribA/ribD-fused uncharacterized protein